MKNWLFIERSYFMAKKKFYAVKVGKIPGIYSTWNECEAQVKGVSGAKYKSFATLKEAEEFLTKEEVQEDSLMNCTELLQESMPVEEFNKMVDAKIAAIKDDEVIAFVDGSYDVSQEKSAFAAIMITSGGNRDTLYKSFTKNLDKDFIALRNVAAELEGVKEAINWSVTYNKKKITVFYDYEGIEKWATGEWRPKKELTKKYVSFIIDKKQVI